MLEMEFTDQTLVYTDQGVQRLVDILHRPVKLCLWAIKWKFAEVHNGISFHPSHKDARKFADMQIDSTPAGAAKLVDVSQHIYDCVTKHGFCWTNLIDFDEAETYQGVTWNH